MPIVFDASSQALSNSGGSSNSTFPFTIGIGSSRMLLVWLRVSAASDVVSAVTYNGSAMTRVVFMPSATPKFYLYALVNPSSGTNNLIVTTGVYVSTNAGVWSCSNALQSIPSTSVTQTSTQAGGVDFTTTLTTPSANCWTVLGSNNNSGSNISAGTGLTMRSNTANSGLAIGDGGGPVTVGSHSLAMQEPATDTLFQIMVAVEPTVTVTTVSSPQGIVF